MKYLTLIRAIALLHQHQRERKTIDHNGAKIEYLHAREQSCCLDFSHFHFTLGIFLPAGLMFLQAPIGILRLSYVCFPFFLGVGKLVSSAAQLHRKRVRSSRGAAQLNAARRAQKAPALVTPRRAV